MAWPVPTYLGEGMIENIPSKARLSLHALCLGVNERERALDVTQTQFYKADGTLSVELTLEDLLDIPATADSGVNYAFENLKRVRAAILDWLDNEYFTEESGVSPVWTLENLEAAIDGDLSVDVEYQASAAGWQALQDALDRLIYARRRTSYFIGLSTDPRHPISTFKHRYFVYGDPFLIFFTSQESWDDMLAWPERDIALNNVHSFPRWAHTATDTISGTIWQSVSVRKTSNLRFENDFLGTLKTIEYEIYLSKENYTGADFNIKIGAAPEVNVGPGSTELYSVYSTEGEVPLSGSGIIAVEVLTSIPATPPSTFEDGEVFGVGSITSTLRMLTFFTYLYFDIASELTDQA